jgi:hypothetical protein
VDGLLQVFRQAALVSDRRRKSIELKGARKLAGRILFQVAEGKDPQAERKAERNSGTFEELATRYVEEYSKVENKSWRQADALVRRHLFPKWAKMSAANITRGDVKAVKAGIESPTVANQTLAAASAIFSWAIVEEVAGVTANPVKGVSGLAAELPRPDAPYELDDEETIVWRDVVEAMPADHFIAANFPILTQYCRHVVEARRIEKMIKEYRDLRKTKAGRAEFSYSIFFGLQEAKLSQSRMVFTLARAMRLTQQANFRQNRRLPKPKSPGSAKDEEKW